MRVEKRILHRLIRAGGVGHTSELATTSYERAVLHNLAAASRITRVRSGTYALPEATDEIRIIRATGGKLTCVSAVAAIGLRTLHQPRKLHLSRSRDHGTLSLSPRLTRLTRVHREPEKWISTANPVEIVPRDYAPPRGLDLAEIFAPWPAVFARLAVCLPLQEAVVSLDSGLESGIIRKEDVLRLLDPIRHKRAWRAVSLASRSSQSVLETVARLELGTNNFQVEPQKRIRNVGFVDLLVEDFIVIELDGFAHHSDKVQFRRDRFRDRELAKLGYRVLRFAYEEVLENPGLIAAEVRALLANRPGV